MIRMEKNQRRIDVIIVALFYGNSIRYISKFSFSLSLHQLMKEKKNSKREKREEKEKEPPKKKKMKREKEMKRKTSQVSK